MRNYIIWIRHIVGDGVPQGHFRWASTTSRKIHVLCNIYADAPTISRHIHRVGTTNGRPQSENLLQKLEIHIMRNYIIWIRHIVGDGVLDVPCNA